MGRSIDRGSKRLLRRFSAQAAAKAATAAIACVACATTAFGQTSSSLNGDTAASNPTATNAPRLTPPPNPQSPPPKQGNLNDNAKQAAASNAIGMGANAVMAGVWFAASYSGEPPGPCSRWEMCAFAALSMAQLAAMAGSRSGADKSAAASQYTFDPGGASDKAGDLGGDGSRPPPSPTLPGAGPNPTARGSEFGPGVFSPQEQSKLAEISRTLAKSGFSVSPDGKSIKLPNGKTVSTAAFGSESGMRGLGLSDSQIAEAQAVAAKGATQVKKDLKGFDDGFGGGGGAGAGALAGGGRSAGDGADYASLFRSRGRALDTRARAAAGMTRQLAGDRIGAAGDDIFQMISRQYQRRDRENEFIK